MRAIRYHDNGSADVLKLEEIAVPEPGADEVLVRVRAAGVNPVDWKQRSGMNPNLPATPGIDVSGLVEKVGAGVHGFEAGQEVWGTGQGTYAEYAIAPANSLVPKPANMSFEEGASFGVGVRTAWVALFESAILESGQTILVQGAAGGVGMWGVQLAKWKGATVIGTASSGNIDFINSLGVDVAVDYTNTPIETVAKDVDFVLDTVGGAVQVQSWQTLKRGGTLVTIVGDPDQEQAEKHGVTAIRVGRPTDSVKIFDTVNELFAAGGAKPLVQKVFPLDQAKQAHELSETTHGRGRIVLSVSG
ncbi:MAG: NADP-dependent oxidoreductase [Chloroflexi bacterium]|jgi:NADPH:quinone reductase-like Zn-dependent oxidoreductase|nr:NADP-dependent oxidoreductase [Chloroflexota bacterium]MBT5318547.1 NADP-dependent oxidoreductase [Chloroflexota bacterium]MBT6680640.1 NADP-dependent oxidoreductase [Chloroflexota bacterium]